MRFSEDALVSFAASQTRVRLLVALAEGEAPQPMVGRLMRVLPDGGLVLHLRKVGDVEVPYPLLRDVEVLIDEEPTPSPFV